ncbi:MAG TPA: ribosomal protein S18-alanine N-acetyltransferase [Rhodopila sp.]|jgi:ribosomal-protein-alanine N-acetyltransferase|nr:ribosomal protein S18-alanine N-acetyltransferase [Rhodopila sp.]
MAPDQIVQATTMWAEAMAAIHAASFPPVEAWDADAFRAQLDLPGVIGLVHPRGGLILIRIAADEAEVLTLAVAPDARRNGFGHALLRQAMETLAVQGAHSLFLEVSVSNPAALALYRKAGFVTAGRRRRYYPDGSDAAVMRCPLIPAS